MVKAEDLRIVKLYSVVNIKKDSRGFINEIEYAKAVPFYVLVKKTGSSYCVIPTSKLKIKEKIVTSSTKPHQLLVDKTRKNDRFRKPIHLIRDLNGKQFTPEQLIAFAEKVENISANLPVDIADEQLKNVCKNALNDILNQKER